MEGDLEKKSCLCEFTPFTAHGPTSACPFKYLYDPNLPCAECGGAAFDCQCFSAAVAFAAAFGAIYSGAAVTKQLVAQVLDQLSTVARKVLLARLIGKDAASQSSSSDVVATKFRTARSTTRVTLVLSPGDAAATKLKEAGVRIGLREGFAVWALGDQPPAGALVSEPFPYAVLFDFAGFPAAKGWKLEEDSPLREVWNVPALQALLWAGRVQAKGNGGRPVALDLEAIFDTSASLNGAAGGDQGGPASPIPWKHNAPGTSFTSDEPSGGPGRGGAIIGNGNVSNNVNSYNSFGAGSSTRYAPLEQGKQWGQLLDPRRQGVSVASRAKPVQLKAIGRSLPTAEAITTQRDLMDMFRAWERSISEAEITLRGLPEPSCLFPTAGARAFSELVLSLGMDYNVPLAMEYASREFEERYRAVFVRGARPPPWDRPSDPNRLTLVMEAARRNACRNWNSDKGCQQPDRCRHEHVCSSCLRPGHGAPACK